MYGLKQWSKGCRYAIGLHICTLLGLGLTDEHGGVVYGGETTLKMGAGELYSWRDLDQVLEFL